MKNLVTPIISIDQYRPKIGEDSETVVVAFEVAFEQPAKDLSNLLETDVVESLDVDISQGPNENGNYIVFAEFKRNKDIYNNIMEIMKVVSNVTGITEWKFNFFKGTSTVDLNEDNLKNSVVDNASDYVLRYNINDSEQTAEGLQRIKHLAGL